jgi:hypothetical protein
MKRLPPGSLPRGFSAKTFRRFSRRRFAELCETPPDPFLRTSPREPGEALKALAWRQLQLEWDVALRIASGDMSMRERLCAERLIRSGLSAIDQEKHPHRKATW